MQLSRKRYNWHMCKLSTITHPLPRKRNICNSLFVCVGEVLLKQWKQGNT